jgi:hypothetical protein
MEWIERSMNGDVGPDRPDYIAYHDGKAVARICSGENLLTATRWRYFLRQAFVEVERLYKFPEAVDSRQTACSIRLH